MNLNTSTCRYIKHCNLRLTCCPSKEHCCVTCHDETEQHEAEKKGAIILCNCGSQTAEHNQNGCASCSKPYASYQCYECLFFTSANDSEIFHCLRCGICRKGNRENFKHCDKCNLCIRNNVEHFCEIRCVICIEDLRSSTKNVCRLPCNHILHQECWNLWSATNPVCPMCRKSYKQNPLIDFVAISDQLAQQYATPPVFLPKASQEILDFILKDPFCIAGRNSSELKCIHDAGQVKSYYMRFSQYRLLTYHYDFCFSLYVHNRPDGSVAVAIQSIFHNDHPPKYDLVRCNIEKSGFHIKPRVHESGCDVNAFFKVSGDDLMFMTKLTDSHSVLNRLDIFVRTN